MAIRRRPNLASYIESMGQDGVEYEKALRMVERRRGELLPEPEPGKRTDLQPLTSALEVDINPMTASRYRKLARAWDEA